MRVPEEPARRTARRVVGVAVGVLLAGAVARTVDLGGDADEGLLTVEHVSEARPAPLASLRAPASPVPDRPRSPSPPAFSPRAFSPSAPSEPHVGRWEDLPPPPVAGRSHPVGAWTGAELLVWGGVRDPSGGTSRDLRADGAALNPATGSWRTLATSPLEARVGAAATWTGEEFVVWGGLGRVAHLGDGARYDPTTDRWAPLPPAPLSPRTGATAVWTGREVVVVGGQDNAGPLHQAAAFDPASGTWRELPSSPRPVLTAGDGARVVWTGERLVVVSDPTGTGPGQATTAVFAAGRDLDGWTALPPPIGGAQGVSVVADGSTVYAAVRDPRGGGAQKLWVLPATAETWTPTPPAPITVGDSGQAIVATGDGVIVVGVDPAAQAARYHRRTDTWDRVASQPPVPSGTVVGPERVAVWTGRALLLWGATAREGAAVGRALRFEAPGP